MGIWRDDQLLGPTAAQQRSVLAMLMMEPGRVVSVDRLVMAIWGEDPPGSARNAVQVQISKLRRILAALPDTELTTSAKGYCLTAPRTAVDLHRFRDLVREARTSSDDRAAELLRAALQLWRGPALADVAGGWLSDTVGAGLEEERRAAVEECAALDVRAGRHHEAIAQLSALVAEHPLRERSVALLMEALRRSGRRADALALFRATRQRYAEELGIEPGEELQRLHRQALEARAGFGLVPGPGPGPGSGYASEDRTGSGSGPAPGDGSAPGAAYASGAGHAPGDGTGPGGGYGSGARPGPGVGHVPGDGAGAGHVPGGRTAPGAGHAPGSGAGGAAGARAGSGTGHDPGAGYDPGARPGPEVGHAPGDGAGAGHVSEAGGRTGPEAGHAPGSGTGGAAGARTGSGAGHDPGPRTGPGAGYDPGARPGPGAGHAPGSGPGPGAGPASGARSASEALGTAGAGDETGHRAVPGAGQAPEPRTASGAGHAPETHAESDAGHVPGDRTRPGTGHEPGARAESGAAGANGAAGHAPEARAESGAGPEAGHASGARGAFGAGHAPGGQTAPGAGHAPGDRTALGAGHAAEPRTSAEAADLGGIPQQLPPDVAHFSGRERELAGLDALLRTGAASTAAGRSPTAAVIGVIAGSGGLGKTTLAVHWAHRVRDRFPDGQLYVNLRGFGPTGSAMTVAEAVRGFLDAFQVPAHRIPATVEAQTALYRSLLADRRVLILLDNARDAEQVRPLLPGSPGCLVVLTSRNELTGLVVAEQARPLPLDLLGRAEARELLAGRIGVERAAAEPQAVEDVVTVCAGLPLALAIVAARAATHPRFSIAALADELHDARGSLDAFEGGDATTDVRAVFSWSYHTLGDDTARLFRLLAVHPGPYIAAPAAASLAGVDISQARRLLSRLTRAHLIAERSPGRYAFHDLLRAYAMELTHEYDSADDRRSALHRVLDHYLHSAVAAGRAFTPHREPVAVAPARSGVTVETFGEHAQALTWFTLEHPVLIAALQRAADASFETHAWQLAWSLMEYLDQLGHWHDQRTVHRIALGAAHRIADPAGQAYACHGMGLADLRMGRYDRARGHLLRSLNLHGEVANHIGQARIHVALNMTAERQGRDEELLYHARRSLELYQVAGHRKGEAYALNNLGWAYARLGDFQQTLVHCAQALALLREAGDGRGESAAWDSLGYAHHHLGDHQQAITCYRHAVALRRTLDERVREAESLHRLGDAQRTAGDVAGARNSWCAALSRFDALGHPDADRVRDELARLGEPEPDSTS
ncbi:AfsR/SARP family transcriptional regulator [Streptomyces himastatinicus]|uniref:AfsR/SARP family transcriptional regulator n=1 Tax=Streptomyces himastatinicus TaxID=998084 RepID=UPI0001B4E4AC|nr:AfsR/SARP family transcriptional regulator [Streptomyces himastatinicus]